MSDITNKQNLHNFIDYLIAQRYYYNLAKKYRNLRLFLSILLALLSPVLIYKLPTSIFILGVVGTLWAIVAYLFKKFLEQNLISKASAIQEEFDVNLFKLEWNSVLVGNKMLPEDIARAKRKFKDDISEFKNWYGDLSDIKYPFDVLLCQRSNLVWDRRLKRKYSFGILLVLFVYFILTIVFSLINELKFVEYILGLFLPALSGYLLGIDEFIGHYGAALKRKELEKTIQSLSEQAIHNTGFIKIEQLRQIQDRIYNFRKGPLIPDWFYWLYKNSYESDMKFALNSFKDKIKQSSINKN